MIKYYTGIGSRSVPDDVYKDMVLLAELASKLDWTLRSGGANGADSAFEKGCDNFDGKKEIYLPWKGFNGNLSPLVSPSNGAFTLANSVHPAYYTLKQGAQKLLARNMHQILGENLNTPTGCVICWTPDGCEHFYHYTRKTGGTGSAIALASKLEIPVFNLYNKNKFKQALSFLINNETDTLYL